MKPYRHRSYGYTDPEVAKRAREKGWKPFKTRADWESSLRSKQKQELPKEAK